MSNRDAAILVFVGVAVLAGLTAIAMLQATVVLVDGEDARLSGRVFALIPTIFLAWCAVHLVRNRVRYSELLFPEATPPGAPADRRSWQVLGVVLVGLHVLLTSLPEFVTWALDVLAESNGVSTAWQEATGVRALSLGRAAPALLDTVIAGVMLVQRDAVVDRLFPQDVVESVEE